MVVMFIIAESNTTKPATWLSLLVHYFGAKCFKSKLFPIGNQ